MYMSPAASSGSATGSDSALPYPSLCLADFQQDALDSLVPQELTGNTLPGYTTSDQTCIGITDPQFSPLEESML